MSNLTVTKGLYYYNNMKENGGKGKQGGKKEKRVSKPKKNKLWKNNNKNF